MPFNPRVHHRRSSRLQNRDYHRGTYFVTICTWQRECLFGEVDAGRMRANQAGMVVAECWAAMGKQPQVMLDEFVVMPNHLHALLTFGERHPGDVPGAASPRTLGQLVGACKAISTRLLREAGLVTVQPVWQHNYHERTVRLDADLTGLRRYIRTTRATGTPTRRIPPSHPFETGRLLPCRCAPPGLGTIGLTRKVRARIQCPTHVCGGVVRRRECARRPRPTLHQ